MNIESKAYKLRSALGARVEVIRKADGATVYVPRSDLPGIAALGAMHERDFDAACADAMGGR
jgi:hypothetical protein